MKNAEAFSSNTKILTPLKTLKELLRFVIPKGNKEMPFRIFLAFIFLFLATIVTVYTPFLYGKAVDLVSEGKQVNLNLLWFVIGSYALARLGQVFFDEAKEFVFARVAQKAVRGAALKAFKHLLIQLLKLLLPAIRFILEPQYCSRQDKDIFTIS